MKFIRYVVEFTSDITGKGGSVEVAATDLKDAESEAFKRFAKWELDGNGHSAAAYTVEKVSPKWEPLTQESGK